MATSKKRGRPSKAENEKQNKKAERDSARKKLQQQNAFIFFVLGLIFTALAFIPGQSVWLALQSVVFGLFGFLAFAIGPLMLFLAVSFAVGKQMPTPQIIKASFLLLSVSGALLLFGTQYLESDFIKDISNLYIEGTQHLGGGAMSMVFGWTLNEICGPGGAAAKVLIVISILIAVMLLTGKTVLDIVNAIKKSSEKVKELREKQKFNRELMQNTAEIEIPAVAAGKDTAPEQRAGTSASIDIPLDDVRSSVDVPLGSVKISKPEIPFSRIDIPLGPSASSQPLEFDVIIPKKTRKKGTGPAADLTEDVFFQEEKRNDLFADFGAEKALSQDELIKRAAAGTVAAKTERGPVTSDIISEYKFPPLSLLDRDDKKSGKDATEEMRATATSLVETLESFGVRTKVVDISRGPTVTRYELQPEVGVRLSKIVSLADDLALNLAAIGVRMEAPIPGKAAVGIEIPNKELRTVRLRTILESPTFREAGSTLTMALGIDLNGETRIWDISKMPHLLIAGSTGMGKSVFINSMLISLIYKSAPEDLKLILIDPKMVEFTVYHGLPHLPVPVVTEPARAAGALGTALAEMLRRYKTFAASKVRNIEEYNLMVEKQLAKNEGPAEGEEIPEKKARWVVVIDELADLMMTSPREVENSICRIAQMGRAAGIHLVVATQRPSVDVITGTIKNNIPTRVAFRVSSQIDSRTILDGGGAEKLIGRGDMLFQPVGQPKPLRLQGCYVSDEEVGKVVEFVKKNAVAQYNEELLREIEENAVAEKGGKEESSEAAGSMLEAAIEVVVEAGKASTSYLQRRLSIGYARAAKIMDDMEEMGIIGQAEGSKPRAVNMTLQQLRERQMNRPDKN